MSKKREIEIEDIQNNKQKEMQEENANTNKELNSESNEDTAKNVEATDEQNKNEETQTSEIEEEGTKEEEKTDNENEKTDDQQAEYDKMKDKYLRLSAEFDNYRKRTLKERMELIKSAGEDILTNILPVMDNFERALKSMDDAKDIDAVKEGVHLIHNNFKEFLKQKGVKEIEAKGKEFDTDIHEAVSKFPAPSKDMKGKVIDVVEKGYMLNEKVIRFAKVVVGE